ncbi:unnamed protein product [Spirodela intermedia]|uniref:Uncharacterized protein n=1 Tax=Spirodela intermedia TaxID=51605 RepID=A0A7I8LKY5_SPIIN|nr:unnamed protein product [Spirodela intermedia]
MPEEMRRPEGDREKLREMPSFRTISESQERTAMGLTRGAFFAPSFRGIVATEALDRVIEEGRRRDGSDDDGDEDFEFAFVSRVSFDGFDPVAAEEIFSEGQILPVYPPVIDDHSLEESEIRRQDRHGGVHMDGEDGDEDVAAEKSVRHPLRKLFADDGDLTATSSSSESSESGELNGVPGEIYCVWEPRSDLPSPDLPKKSRSTGTSSKRWRLLDLVASRSHSDGKDKFIFISASQSTAAGEKSRKSSGDKNPPNTKKRESLAESKKNSNARARTRVAGMDMATAHRLFYMNGVAVSGDPRRSFLPYRKDLLGIFSNLKGPPVRSAPLL